jgi:hypothetical protein
MLAGDRLTVARARLRGASTDDRRALEAALQRVDLARLGLPPRSVLYVPRLAPAARLRRRDPGPLGAAVENALAREAREAVRFTGGGPAGRALLFDSEADFFAWMLDGWLRRIPEPQAALSALAGPRTPEAFVVREILGRGELLPALFARLAARETLVPFVALLAPSQARDARQAIVAAHGLRFVSPGPPREPRPARRWKLRRAQATDDFARTSADERGGSSVSDAALRDAVAIVPEAFVPLAPEARGLMVLALALARRPAWARSEAGVRCVAAVAAVRRAAGMRVPPAAQLDMPTAREAPLIMRLPVVEPIERPIVDAAEPPGTRRQAAKAGLGADQTAIEQVDTALGGLLFVLGLFLRLGLYADFTQPGGVDLPISPWLLLRRLGRRWFGARTVGDPLDGVLARLAGVAPGARLARAPRKPALRPIERRVREAVVERLGLNGRAALATLCIRPARVMLSPGALDAVFSLDEHAVAIRIAGLDRDPGWIPAAGRVVGFHFR